MEMTSAFTLNVRLDNIAVITIDVPGEKMNTLKAEFASQVRAIIKQLRENKELRGVVFVSAKPDNFIAGADINMIGNCKTAQEAEALARQGQQLMAEIHALPIPVIAAIHGACLGGGLELALACHGRVCTIKLPLHFIHIFYGYPCIFYLYHYYIVISFVFQFTIYP